MEITVFRQQPPQIHGWLTKMALPHGCTAQDVVELLRGAYGGGVYKIQLMKKVGTKNRFTQHTVSVPISGVPLVDGEPWIQNASKAALMAAQARNQPMTSASPVIFQNPSGAAENPVATQLLDLVNGLIGTVKAQSGGQQDVGSILKSIVGAIPALSGILQGSSATRNPFADFREMMITMNEMRGFAEQSFGGSDRSNRSSRSGGEESISDMLTERLGARFIDRITGDSAPRSNFVPPGQPRPGDVWHPGLQRWIPYPDTGGGVPPQSPSARGASPAPSSAPSPQRHDASPPTSPPPSPSESSPDDENDGEAEVMSVEELVDEIASCSEEEQQRFISLYMRRMGLDPSMVGGLIGNASRGPNGGEQSSADRGHAPHYGQNGQIRSPYPVDA